MNDSPENEGSRDDRRDDSRRGSTGPRRGEPYKGRSDRPRRDGDAPRSGADRNDRPRREGEGYRGNRDASSSSDRGGYRGNRDGASSSSDRGGYRGNRDGASSSSDRGGYRGNRDASTSSSDRGGYRGSRDGSSSNDRGGYRGNREEGSAPRRDVYRAPRDGDSSERRPYRGGQDGARSERPAHRGGRDRPNAGGPRPTRDGDRPARGDRTRAERDEYYSQLSPEERAALEQARALRAIRPQHDDPEIPEGVLAKDLDRIARNELKALSKENAEFVALHLVMAARLIDDDPDLAHRHATSAARRAGRIAVARETLAITAYATGDFALAIRELRTHRRISGSNEQLALLIDSERGVGRPERALEAGRSVPRNELSVPTQVSVAIALSGARLDQGDAEAALDELEIPQLDPNKAFSYSPSLFRAYAAVLEDLGRAADSAKWEELAHRAEVALGSDTDDDLIEVFEVDEPFDEFGDEVAVELGDEGDIDTADVDTADLDTADVDTADDETESSSTSADDKDA